LTNKVKIKEVAEELSIKTKDLIDICEKLGITGLKALSSISSEDASKVMDYYLYGRGLQQQKVEEIKEELPKVQPKDPTILLKEVEEIIEPEVTIDNKVEKLPAEQRKKKILQKNPIKFTKKIADTIVEIKIEPAIEEKFVKDLKFKDDKKKKKDKAKVIQKAPILTKRLSINRDFKQDDEDEQKNSVVFLPDFSMVNTKEEDEHEIKSKLTKTFDNKKIPGMTQNISRVKRRKSNRNSNSNRSDDIKINYISIPEEIRVYEFAEKINKPLGEVIKILFNLGKMVTKNDFLNKDEIEILADHFEVEINISNVFEELDYVTIHEEDTNEEQLAERAPIVTIMGHVDHGKTSLLDKIRDAKVAHGEAGGITQHIGAYQVNNNGKMITFLDTPGHEAFTQMRARGASLTDIAIIVVAADDGVMPQTVEAINHAKAAQVPFIIAINKMDKPTANPDFVKSGLADIDVTPIEWGGKTEFIEISAKTGKGIDDLLDTILIQAEILELKADVTKKAKAIVIESSIEKGRGPVCTVIIQDGRLRVGDNVVVGPNYGRVRAILDDLGEAVKELLPSQPGQILGLDGVANSGETLLSVENDKIAKDFAEKKKEYIRQKELSKSTKATLDDIGHLVALGQLKRIDVVLKTDVQGSLEAIKSSIEKLQNDEARINIVHSAVGAITENDVALASAGENTIIIGFNVKPNTVAKEKAKESGVDIRFYSVIYDIIDDLKVALGEMLSPVYKEENLGRAEIREIFTVGKTVKIAGCMVTDGVIQRNANVRVIRNSKIIFDGKVDNLKRFKDDAKEVKAGFECGITVDGFNEIEKNDVLECYKMVAQKVKVE
jgi:translation initiation factor IF-2